MLNVWVIPEPLLHGSLSNLPFKEGGQEYTIQIWTDKQRIENDALSPDLAPYFLRFPLSRHELLALNESREVDASVRRERLIARGEEGPGADERDDDSAPEPDTRKLLTTVEQALNEEGYFDPEGITDARERVLSSIVRRRGQPTFRQHLLAAYNGRCAVTGCDVEAVLDAAHIVPYLGPKTDLPGNGLLLRTDLHTLFDLKLIVIDVATMSLVVSPTLSGTCYEEYRGRLVRLPDDPTWRPSQRALEQHRREARI